MLKNEAPRLKIPQQISPYARLCLTVLAERGLGGKISLCGAFAMAYYYEYRPTLDVDAWWEEETNDKEKAEVIQCLKESLESWGRVSHRRWGEVYSLELVPAGEERVVFSFQIADRSAKLQESVPAPWPETIQLDSLADLLASKMAALVERGAPRDFRDIYTFCQAGLTSPSECWDLWKRRQHLVGSDPDFDRARLAILTHLARIANHRPLDQIIEPEERQKASKLREWFRSEFIDAPLA